MLPPDTELIARVLAHDDRHAFGELVRRNQSPLRVLLRRLTCGDHALADDLAQEALLRAYRGLRGYRSGGRFSSWLYRIGYNAFLTHVERSKTRPETVTEPIEAPVSRGQGRRAELQHDLERAMAALRPEERAAITLSFFEQLTHEEIAMILDCPLGTVKTHIARGKVQLQQSMKPWRGEA